MTRARKARTVALASYIGTTIEWYDFFIYGIAAALVFAHTVLPRRLRARRDPGRLRHVRGRLRRAARSAAS